jgi:hypothetical protein
MGFASRTYGQTTSPSPAPCAFSCPRVAQESSTGRAMEDVKDRQLDAYTTRLILEQNLESLGSPSAAASAAGDDGKR